ncbi:MAG: hypothetical protein M0Z38_03900 [Deltaproteobacteria bacterium]|nr:hypothetical protein [Deltaproteobacteria bacterium]
MNTLQGIKKAPVVQRRFAARFLTLLLAIIGSGSAALFLAFYVIFTRELPGTYSGVYFALRNLYAFLVPILAFSVLAYVLAVGVAVTILCGYTFHKIAGPIYRLERAMENYESGDPVRAVFLRDGDQLVPLGHAFNVFVAHLRQDRQEWIATMEHAERVCIQDAAICRAEMGEALGRLLVRLSRYR